MRGIGDGIVPSGPPRSSGLASPAVPPRSREQLADEELLLEVRDLVLHERLEN